MNKVIEVFDFVRPALSHCLVVMVSQGKLKPNKQTALEGNLTQGLLTYKMDNVVVP